MLRIAETSFAKYVGTKLSQADSFDIEKEEKKDWTFSYSFVKENQIYSIRPREMSVRHKSIKIDLKFPHHPQFYARDEEQWKNEIIWERVKRPMNKFRVSKYDNDDNKTACSANSNRKK